MIYQFCDISTIARTSYQRGYLAQISLIIIICLLVGYISAPFLKHFISFHISEPLHMLLLPTMKREIVSCSVCRAL